MAGDVRGSSLRIPVLRSRIDDPPSLDPRDYARSTCYLAGHLVEKNAGWRNVRPVVDAAACTGCLQCYLYCPDGTIRRTPGGVCSVAVDYDFCKGCGICSKMCRFGAISMVDEAAASGDGQAVEERKDDAR